jgi:hypothetical protein
MGREVVLSGPLVACWLWSIVASLVRVQGKTEAKEVTEGDIISANAYQHATVSRMQRCLEGELFGWTCSKI